MHLARISFIALLDIYSLTAQGKISSL